MQLFQTVVEMEYHIISERNCLMLDLIHQNILVGSTIKYERHDLWMNSELPFLRFPRL